MMKNLLTMVALIATTFMFAQTITVTQNPTTVNENGVSASGPAVFKMQVRNWPINAQIYARIKTGTNPDAAGSTDWKKLNPDPFLINSATTTNAGPLVTVSPVTVGSMVTFAGQTKQGYNVDLEWSSWSAGGAAVPSAAGANLILGGAGFFNNAFGTDKVVITGSTVFTYAPVSSGPANVVTFNFTDFIVQSASVAIPIKYTASSPVAVGGIKFQLFSDTTPYTRVAIGTYGNTAILPAGVDMLATIPVTNVPALFTVGNVAGGVLLYNVQAEGSAGVANQLLARNPNGVASPTAAYYRLIGVSGEDANFTAILPEGFRGIRENVSLGKADFQKNAVSVYPNPARDIINISDSVVTKGYSVIDFSGKTVLSGPATGTLNVSSLAKGVYILMTDEGSVKFFKE